MGVFTRLDPVRDEIRVMLADLTSPQARSRVLASAARDAIARAEARNRQILGRTTPRTTFVDGRPSEALEMVRPDGVIVAEFEVVNDTLAFIRDQLFKFSPVGSKADRRPGHPGFFRSSNALFVDGSQVAIDGRLPNEFDEAVFLNLTPYARKIERGLSRQRPQGVYQDVARLASRRFGNVASIRFAYRSPFLRYVAGAANRQDRRNMRNGAFAQVFAAQARERATRVPAIIVRVR